MKCESFITCWCVGASGYNCLLKPNNNTLYEMSLFWLVCRVTQKENVKKNPGCIKIECKLVNLNMGYGKQKKRFVPKTMSVRN